MRTVPLSQKTILDLQKMVSKINRLNETAKELNASEKVKNIKFTLGGKYSLSLLELLKPQLEELDIKVDWFTESNLFVKASNCEIIIIKMGSEEK